MLPFEGTQLINEDEVIKYISKHKDLLDAVVVTGGEPTLQPDLPEFLAKIKLMGFLVKLDTNGTNPEMLERILDAGLVDYVAMDVKTSPIKYETLTGWKDLNKIRESIKIIKEDSKGYEFRSTVIPDFFTFEDAKEIVNLMGQPKIYILQSFNSKLSWKEEFKEMEPCSQEEMEELCRFFNNNGIKTIIR